MGTAEFYKELPEEYQEMVIDLARDVNSGKTDAVEAVRIISALYRTKPSMTVTQRAYAVEKLYDLLKKEKQLYLEEVVTEGITRLQRTVREESAKPALPREKIPYLG